MRYFILSGILLGLSYFHPTLFSILTFVFLIPILTVLHSRQMTDKETIYLMFFTSFISISFYTISLMIAAYPLDWLKVDSSMFSIFVIFIVWFVLTFIMSLPLSLWFYAMCKARHLSALRFSLLGSALWIILEMIRSYGVGVAFYGKEVLLGPHHTYGVIGYASTLFPIISDTIAVGGIYLGSFVLILINFSIYNVWKKKDYSVLIFSVTLVLISYAVMFYLRSDNSKDMTISILLGNAKFTSVDNIFFAQDKRTKTESEILKSEKGEDVIVAPENIDLLSSYNKDNTFFKKYKGVIISSLILNQQEKLFFLNTKENTMNFYSKQLLMPLGEYAVESVRMFLNILPNDKWIWLYNSNVANLKRGQDKLNTYSFVKDEKVITIAGIVCAELYSPYIASYGVKKGANILVAVLSHAPLHGSRIITEQTLYYFKGRSIESGRYTIVSSNYSDSYVISDAGELIFKMDNRKTMDDSIIFSNTFAKIKEYKTPYIVFGNYILIISLFIVLYSFIYIKKDPR